ncbi:N-acetylglucosamine/diacetylchitobiose ABC transporter substrate-binding protein [Longispora sp. NPDC051575]|uniref:N-acetylglucosamine/diacetylchitobiose ABC transporter substrate-binding protein n=1 Tax=Longispora sp. NPDC051575 TaxID=3154943 RepID=UPI00342236D3
MSKTPDLPGEVSRRTVITRAAAIGAAIPAAGLLGACAGGGTEEKKSETGNTGDAKNPFGVKDGDPLEVVIFNGGYGEKYAKDIHEPMYKAAFPKSEIKHSAPTEISTTIQPRFAGGNPPDFLNNSGAKAIDIGSLVGDGQLLTLDKLWSAPSYDDPKKTVKDTLIPGTIESGEFDGKSVQLNYVFTVYGIWYNSALFSKNSWVAPKTWDETTALFDKIKAAGITPYAYAGANAAYYQFEVILSNAAKIGGAEVLKNIDNLEDGAWQVPAIKDSLEFWAGIGAKYMDKAHEGLKHTEVQLQQNQGKVAFYPSGSWLENEQAKETPADFKYAMTLVPSKGASDKIGFTGIHATAGEPYVIPAKAKNQAGALEYMRIMLSKKGANEFVKLNGSLTSVIGSSDGATLTPGTASAKTALDAAGKDVFTFHINDWYADMNTEMKAATNALMFGHQNVAQFVERVQKAADKLKKDSSIKKNKVK